MIFEAFENAKTGSIYLVGFAKERDCADNIPAYIETGYEFHPGDLSHDLADAASEAFRPWPPEGGGPAAGINFLNSEIGRKYFSLYADSSGKANEYLRSAYNDRAENLKCVAHASPYLFEKNGFLHGGISINDKERSIETSLELGNGFFALDAEKQFDSSDADRPRVYMFLPVEEPSVTYYDKSGKQVESADCDGGYFSLSGLVVSMDREYKRSYLTDDGQDLERPLPVPVYEVTFNIESSEFDPKRRIDNGDYQPLVNASLEILPRETDLFYDFFSRRLIEPPERADAKEFAVCRPLYLNGER